MKTYFYSETLDKAFETKEDCMKAEQEYADKMAEKKAAEEKAKAEAEAKSTKRAEDAKKVEAAYNNLQDVRANCRKMIDEADADFKKELNAFCEKYHSYHWSINTKDIPHLFTDFFNLF